jgi:hypothetical protein
MLDAICHTCTCEGSRKIQVEKHILLGITKAPVMLFNHSVCIGYQPGADAVQRARGRVEPLNLHHCKPDQLAAGGYTMNVELPSAATPPHLQDVILCH